MSLLRPSSKQVMPEHAVCVFQGQIFNIYQWDQAGYDGSSRTFEKLKRLDTALVIPILEDGTIIYAYEEQPGKPAYLSLLGGRVDQGEEALAAAQRELREESGYEANAWKLFDAYQPYSKIDWCIWLFTAKGCRKVAEQKLDGAEKIELRRATFDEFVGLVLNHGLGDERLKIVFLEAKLDSAKMEALRKRFS